MFRNALLAICSVFWLACTSTPDRPIPGDIASAYHAAGRLDEASREIEIAVRTRPKDLSLRRQAARINSDAGMLERAVGHLEMATRISPNDPGVWLELADLELGRDNDADAYVAYRRAAKLEPDDIHAVSGLAQAAESLGFSEEAEAAYERWEALQNGFEQASD